MSSMLRMMLQGSPRDRSHSKDVSITESSCSTSSNTMSSSSLTEVFEGAIGNRSRTDTDSSLSSNGETSSAENINNATQAQQRKRRSHRPRGCRGGRKNRKKQSAQQLQKQNLQQPHHGRQKLPPQQQQQVPGEIMGDRESLSLCKNSVNIPISKQTFVKSVSIARQSGDHHQQGDTAGMRLPNGLCPRPTYSGYNCKNATTTFPPSSSYSTINTPVKNTITNPMKHTIAKNNPDSSSGANFDAQSTLDVAAAEFSGDTILPPCPLPLSTSGGQCKKLGPNPYSLTGIPGCNAAPKPRDTNQQQLSVPFTAGGGCIFSTMPFTSSGTVLPEHLPSISEGLVAPSFGWGADGVNKNSMLFHGGSIIGDEVFFTHGIPPATTLASQHHTKGVSRADTTALTVGESLFTISPRSFLTGAKGKPVSFAW